MKHGRATCVGLRHTAGASWGLGSGGSEGGSGDGRIEGVGEDYSERRRRSTGGGLGVDCPDSALGAMAKSRGAYLCSLLYRFDRRWWYVVTTKLQTPVSSEHHRPPLQSPSPRFSKQGVGDSNLGHDGALEAPSVFVIVDDGRRISGGGQDVDCERKDFFNLRIHTSRPGQAMPRQGYPTPTPADIVAIRP